MNTAVADPLAGKEVIRLVICAECASVDQLPDYKGPVDRRGNPTDDFLLVDLLKRHPKHPDGSEHFGSMMRVDARQWRDPVYQAEILRRVFDKDTGFGKEFYAVKATYQEDAMKCYSQHGRPKDGCIDWCDDSKLLGGQRANNGRMDSRIHLCMFCPVSTFVTTEIRYKKGYYA